MSQYYQTGCGTEEAASKAFHAVDELFDPIEGVTSYARKRSGTSLLWRLDGESAVVERMLAALHGTELFSEVNEISEEAFWEAASDPV